MKKSFLIAIFSTLLVAECEISNNTLTLTSLPENTKQLIVVTTKDMNSTSGILQRYEKSQKWQKVGEKVEVILGQNGLAFGRGICKLNQVDNLKIEGDKKSPAGIFELGSAFGYESEKFKYEYIQSSKNLKCIDDSNSINYNKILYDNHIKRDYKSFEDMKRKDDLYALGIAIMHNKEAVKNGGSCIFMHIKNINPTLGCTAMKKEELREIINWLRVEKEPLFIQLPQNIFQSISF